MQSYVRASYETVTCIKFWHGDCNEPQFRDDGWVLKGLLFRNEQMENLGLNLGKVVDARDYRLTIQNCVNKLADENGCDSIDVAGSRFDRSTPIDLVQEAVEFVIGRSIDSKLFKLIM